MLADACPRLKYTLPVAIFQKRLTKSSSWLHPDTCLLIALTSILRSAYDSHLSRHCVVSCIRPICATFPMKTDDEMKKSLYSHAFLLKTAAFVTSFPTSANLRPMMRSSNFRRYFELLAIRDVTFKQRYGKGIQSRSIKHP